MKACKDCARELPLECFPKHPSAADGHINQCKACRKAYKQKYLEKNRKKVLRASKEYYEKHSEAVKERVRSNYLEKREEILERKREEYKEHGSCVKKGRQLKRDLPNVTLEMIINHKKQTPRQLYKSLKKLKEYEPTSENVALSKVGNTILWHFQIENMMRVRAGSSDNTLVTNPSFIEVWQDEESREEFFKNLRKQKYMLQRSSNENVCVCLWTFWQNTLGNRVSFFKPTMAMYVYKTFGQGATSILDPTAGWGGRMIAAWVMGLKYTGIDTNVEMKRAYEGLEELLDRPEDLRMIWKDCLKVDFSRLHYDFVFTSPPYFMQEKYEHMQEWENAQAFTKDFLKPLIERCVKHIQPGGKVCFNMTERMYNRCVKAGMAEAVEATELPHRNTHLHATRKTNNNMVYVFTRTTA